MINMSEWTYLWHDLIVGKILDCPPKMNFLLAEKVFSLIPPYLDVAPYNKCLFGFLTHFCYHLCHFWAPCVLSMPSTPDFKVMVLDGQPL